MSRSGRPGALAWPGMDLVSMLGLGAASFGVVMALAPLLQARQILRRRDGDDVSISFLAIIACGAAMWAAYGLAAGDPVIVVPNALGVLTNSATVALAWRFRHPAGAAQAV